MKHLLMKPLAAGARVTVTNADRHRALAPLPDDPADVTRCQPPVPAGVAAWFSALNPTLRLIHLLRAVAVVAWPDGDEATWTMQNGANVGRTLAFRLGAGRRAALPAAWQRREARLWERLVLAEDAKHGFLRERLLARRTGRPSAFPKEHGERVWEAERRVKHQYENLDLAFRRNGDVPPSVRAAVRRAWLASADRLPHLQKAAGGLC
jgi:hypothetical protein